MLPTPILISSFLALQQKMWSRILKMLIILGLLICYLSRLSVTILSWDRRACKLVWGDLSVWATTKWSPNWSAFGGKLVPSPADGEKRFTHLQLFVAKHVAISNLVWQRSHNDRRVMGPQLPPTVKVEPGLPNCKPCFSVLENSSSQASDCISQILWALDSHQQSMLSQGYPTYPGPTHKNVA